MILMIKSSVFGESYLSAGKAHPLLAHSYKISKSSSNPERSQLKFPYHVDMRD